ncbi:MAG: metal-dependent transcriptional regulator [Clostridia bacterium]
MQESGETYLETILTLGINGPVRSIDIAGALGYSKPSVSRAMSILRENGYIVIWDGHIELTETGREKAARIYERHCLITQYLMDTLQIPESIAAQDACRIEHVISETSFAKIKARYCTEESSSSKEAD